MVCQFFTFKCSYLGGVRKEGPTPVTNTACIDVTTKYVSNGMV